MANVIKKIYYWLLPKERIRKASDTPLTLINGNGRQCRVYVPVCEQGEKDGYHTKPLTLPQSMDKHGGYGYLRGRGN